MKFNRKMFEIIDSGENLDNGFEDILELSQKCKFSDCTHTTESDCEVKKAISQGILSEEEFKNYHRVKKEAEYIFEQKNKTKAIDYMKLRKLFQKP